MQTAKFYLNLSMLMICLVITGCAQRNPDQIWDDSKSAGRHMYRGFKTMWGHCADSRAVCSRDEFMPLHDGSYFDASGMSEFVPLQDQSPEDTFAMAEYVSRQPRETPGEPGSSVPGIEFFRDPSMNPALAGTFRNVYFEYNSNLVKGNDNLNIVRDISNYMQRNPNTYIFIEGHCDERGPEAYNLALGSRRSNAVRNMLIQEGVNPDNIFTISYGKERPLIHESHEEAWAQNRRAEFKVYQRN